MKILEVHGDKKTVQSYIDGHITLSELMEGLEWHWDKKIFRGTRAPIVQKKDVSLTPVLKQDRQSKLTS